MKDKSDFEKAIWELLESMELDGLRYRISSGGLTIRFSDPETKDIFYRAGLAETRLSATGFSTRDDAYAYALRFQERYHAFVARVSNIKIETVSEEPKVEKSKKDTPPTCPQCGGMMRLRHRRSDNSPFWGCRLYPACKGTRNYDETQITIVKSEVDSSIVYLGEKEIRLSKYQDGMMKTVTGFEPNDNAVVEAIAGSGKTTSIAIACGLLPKDAKILVLVFNKHNVQPVRDKVPAHVDVKTYHSYLFSGCRRAYGADIDIEEDKVYKLLERFLDKSVWGYTFPTINSIVSLVKANLDDTSFETLSRITDYHGIETNGDTGLIFEAVQKVVAYEYEESKDWKADGKRKVIDYNDQCWLPVIHDLPVDKYDFVFIDEAQDTNINQSEGAKKAAAPGGHIIAVGDRRQSMYGFRGADANAIPNLIESLSAKIIPLSLSYRAPKCIGNLVNEKFPDITFEVPEWAKEGEILHVSEEAAMGMYKPGDMVLCRTNAPLVPPVFELIRMGIKATIRGRDIGKGLVSLIQKMKVNDIVELITKLGEYRDKEVEKLTAADKSNQAANLKDKVDTIIALADGVYTVPELQRRIERVFSDKVEGVIFSSIHRAKGLEAESVFILRPELLPHPMAKKEWEKIQEQNIEYVAITRTLDKLVYVH